MGEASVLGCVGGWAVVGAMKGLRVSEWLQAAWRSQACVLVTVMVLVAVLPQV